MKPSQILSKLRKRLGPNASYRQDMKAPGAFGRAQHYQAAQALNAQLQDAVAKTDARRRELLAADPQYVELRQAREELRKRYAEACGKSNHYPITVGQANSLFFSVKVQGDSWKEVFALLDKAAGA